MGVARTEKEMIVLLTEKGLKCNPRFKCVCEIQGYPSNQRRFLFKRIDTLETKEMSASHVIQGKSPWGRAMSLKDIQNKINEVGLNGSPPFKFFAHATPIMHKNKPKVAVTLQRIDTKEKKTVTYVNTVAGHNPWGGNMRSEKDLEKIINELGQKNAEKYKFIKHLPQKGANRMVQIQSIKYKTFLEKEVSSLQRGYNPFLRIYNFKKVQDIVDPIGRKSNPKFKMIRLLGPTNDKRSRHIEIENLVTGEVKISNMKAIVAGKNPWTNILSDKDIKKTVNKMGKKGTPKFKFVSIVDRKPPITVKIENIKTKEQKNHSYALIRNNSNPWDNNHLIELKVVQPEVESKLKLLGIEFKREVNIGPGCRVDFVCTLSNGKKVLIECKSDKRNYSKNALDGQIKRYIEAAKEKYKKIFHSIYLVSLKGIHGISVEELVREFTKNNFHK